MATIDILKEEEAPPTPLFLFDCLLKRLEEAARATSISHEIAVERYENHRFGLTNLR